MLHCASLFRLSPCARPARGYSPSRSMTPHPPRLCIRCGRGALSHEGTRGEGKRDRGLRFDSFIHLTRSRRRLHLSPSSTSPAASFHPMRPRIPRAGFPRRSQTPSRCPPEKPVREKCEGSGAPKGAEPLQPPASARFRPRLPRLEGFGLRRAALLSLERARRLPALRFGDFGPRDHTSWDVAACSSPTLARGLSPALACPSPAIEGSPS